MITVYQYNCSHARKKLEIFLNENNLQYRILAMSRLSFDMFKEMLRATTIGVEEFIIMKSPTFKRNNIDPEDMSLKELYVFAMDHPEVFKKPISYNGKIAMGGILPDKLELFKPRSEEGGENLIQVSFTPRDKQKVGK